MIIVFPMLTSKAVSPNVIPGVAKVIENYIMLNRVDTIIDTVNSSGSGMKMSLKGKKFIMTEGDRPYPPPKETPAERKRREEEEFGQSYSDRIDKEKDKAEERKYKEKQDHVKRGRSYADNAYDKMQKDNDRDNDRAYKQKDQLAKEKREELRKKQDDAKKSNVSLWAPEGKSISVEPSWMTVNVRKNGTESTMSIGIKVVPFPVKSDVTLAQLMLADSQMHKLSALAVGWSRKFQKAMWNMWYSGTGNIPLMGRASLTGDPRKDILIARSNFKEDIFSCVNYHDLDDNFFRSPGNMNQLYQLGWSHVIATDDVNKRAYFCMKEYGGMCNAIQYAYMFNAIKQKDVYDDLEDVRKSSSPFFRHQVKSTKLFSEAYTDQLKEHYRG